MAAETPAAEGLRPTERPITKLELENFRSYAGLKTIGRTTTASTRSSDRMARKVERHRRYDVCVWQAARSLPERFRAYPQLGRVPRLFARVNVHFVNVVDDPDGGEGVVLVAGTECVISRVAKKDNTSKYMITGKRNICPSRRRAGQAWHRSQEQPLLILQGEVEQISQMAPLASKPGETGLLEYLEEIIGSNVFVEPITKSSADYDLGEESRTQSKNRMRAAEKTREGLWISR